MNTTEHHDTGHPLLGVVLLAKAQLAELADMSLWAMDAATTARLVREIAAVTAQWAELEARVIGHADTLGLADAAGMRSTAQWLARTTTVTVPAAHQKVRLALGSRDHEPTRLALARGDLHVEQATVITRAVDQLSTDDHVVTAHDRGRAEQHLLDQAADHDAKALATLGDRLLEVLDPSGADAHEARLLERQEARARAKTSFSMRDDGQGLTRGTFAMPAAQASMLKKALVALAAPKHVRAVEGAGSYDWQTPTPARLGKAFVDLVERLPASALPKLGGLNATVVAIGDHQILLGKIKAARLDTGVRISHTEYLRLACEAGVIPAWMDTTTGHVLSLGRTRRFHTPAQRLALTIERDHCEEPGCHTPAWLCHVHHATPWTRGGNTDLTTALLLCPFHHHRAHTTGATYPMRT